MPSETPEERNRKRACKEEVVILIDNVLLALKMNNSLLSVQDINNHMSMLEYLKIGQAKTTLLNFWNPLMLLLARK